MATAKQIEANRKNAQNSTGPKTATGKATVAQNATKHGLTAQNAVIKGEDPADFDLHRDEMLDHYDPQGPVETALTHRIITLSWQLKRAPNLHTAVINYEIDTVQGYTRGNPDPELILGEAITRLFTNPSILDRLMLYERRIENSLHKSMNALANLKQSRKTNPTPTPQASRMSNSLAHADRSTPTKPTPTENEKTNPIPTPTTQKTEKSQNKPNPTQHCHCAERSDKAISTPTKPTPTENEKTNPITTPESTRDYPSNRARWPISTSIQPLQPAKTQNARQQSGVHNRNTRNITPDSDDKMV